MLVLTRKKNESIIIGNDIEIKVLRISGNVVEIGIEAPRALSILRHEVFQEVRRKNLEAIQSLEKTDLNSLKKMLKE